MFGIRKRKSAFTRYRKLRESIRQEFAQNRRSVTKEIYTHFPDAKILISPKAQFFIAFSRENQKIVGGNFCDLPDLEFLSEGRSDDSYNSAITEYQRKLDTKNRYIISEGDVSRPFKDDQFEHKNWRYLRDGYRLEAYDARRLTSISLLIDEDLIWKASIENRESCDDLRREVYSQWVLSDKYSSRESFELELVLELTGYGSGTTEKFSCRFLGGVGMTGRAKEHFTTTVLQPTIDFVEHVYWKHGTRYHLDLLEENEEFRDDFYM